MDGSLVPGAPSALGADNEHGDRLVGGARGEGDAPPLSRVVGSLSRIALEWDVRPPTFFNRTEAADSPAPMVAYKHRHGIPQSQLVDLGPPEGLAGTELPATPASRPALTTRPAR